MNNTEAFAYVQASAALLRLPMDEAQKVRVAAHLQRTAALARLLDGVAMPPELEPAEIYKPKEHVPLYRLG